MEASELARTWTDGRHGIAARCPCGLCSAMSVAIRCTAFLCLTAGRQLEPLTFQSKCFCTLDFTLWRMLHW